MLAPSPDRTAGRSPWRIAYRKRINEPVKFRLSRLYQKIWPNNPEVYHKLARGFASRGRMCEAFNAMSRAVSLRPDNREWRATLDKYHAAASAEAEAAPTSSAGAVAVFRAPGGTDARPTNHRD